MTPIKPVSIVPPMLAKSWRKIFIALLAWLVLYVLFDIPNRFFYWEREWLIPTDPREKAAYDFAHSIPLPKQAPIGGFKYLKVNKNFKVPVSEKNMPLIETTIPEVPDPVPFSFAWARFKSLFGLDEPVRVQYFNHLCETEAAEYIYKRVDKVEGIYQMRPMPKRTEALMQDRYGFENPADWSLGEADGSPTLFIGGPSNGFLYFESNQNPKQIVNDIFGKNWVSKIWKNTNTPPYWHYHGYNYVTDSNMIAEPVSQLQSKYGYTWRGITRPFDRRYGIAGGELLVINMLNNEILGFRRSFAIAKNFPSGLNWEFAYFCPSALRDYQLIQKREVVKLDYPFSFIKQVLKPINFNPRQQRS